MKTYIKPSVTCLSLDSMKVKTQGGSQFTLSSGAELSCDDCCSFPTEQNFNGWLIGPIQEGASIQVNLSPDDSDGDTGESDPAGGVDLVLSILDANNNPITGCVNDNGIGAGESAAFVAPNTGIYEIHVHNIDVGNCSDCTPSYRLDVSGNQAQPTTFSLEQTEECVTDTCQHAQVD